MLYQSKYASLLVLVRSGSVTYHPATGVEIGRVSPLHADFGVHGGEFMMEDPLTGETDRHAVIYGHFFDSEAAKERLNWTDEEHDSVIYTLDRLCQSQPFLIAKVDQHAMQAPLAAGKPWPNYDEMHWRAIAPAAESVGLVREALAYETENRAREGVLAALEERLEAPVQAVVEEEAITL